VAIGLLSRFKNIGGIAAKNRNNKVMTTIVVMPPDRRGLPSIKLDHRMSVKKKKRDCGNYPT